MLVIGHRGAKGLAPENTLSSLQRAVSENVDTVEVDLRIRNDQKIILSHDLDKTGEYKNSPELAEILSALQTPINLEVKETGFEAKLIEIIKQYPSKVLISSFKPKVLKKIRALDRSVSLGPIIDSEWKSFFYLLLVFCKLIKAESIHVHNSLATPTRIKWAHKFGLRVYVWVINSEEEFNKVKNLGVDGVFTDRPDLIKK